MGRFAGGDRSRVRTWVGEADGFRRWRLARARCSPPALGVQLHGRVGRHFQCQPRVQGQPRKLGSKSASQFLIYCQRGSGGWPRGTTPHHPVVLSTGGNHCATEAVPPNWPARRPASWPLGRSPQGAWDIRPVSMASSATAMTCPFTRAGSYATPRSPDDDPSPGWLVRTRSHWRRTERQGSRRGVSEDVRSHRPVRPPAARPRSQVCTSGRLWACPDLNVGERE